MFKRAIRNGVLLCLVLSVCGSNAQNVAKNNSNLNSLYLNPSHPIEERVEDLMKRMTLEDKVYQMNQFVGLDHMKSGNPDDDKENNDAQGFYKTLSVNDVTKMCEEGKIGSFLHVLTAEEANYLQELALKSPLKIPVLIGIDAIHGNALVSGTTVYPSPIGLASTWNDELLYSVGKQTAKEMRATGSHWTFTPNIDILRDPRWGRVGETLGEDPFMVGNMGAAMVRGFQQGDFTGTQKVIACAKHLIGGGESVNGLNAAPADISVRTLREVHLPPYKKAIDAGLYSIMAAHNEINGVPSHMSKWLMTDILRDEWNFEGFYVSDWLDIERIDKLHHVAKDMKEASYLSVNAGMDMHMHGPKFTDAIIASVKEGKLSINRINEACRKILTAKFKLGLFENRFVNLDKKGALLFTDEHKSTALESARKGIILLKNNGLLPLPETISKKKIFVTGPNANNQSILGDWHAAQPDENVTTIYEGIKTLGETKGYVVDFFNSGENIRNIQSSKIKEAAKKAKNADYAIVVVGDNSMRYKWKDKTAGENMGRSNLDLFGKQLDLVKAIKKTGTPVIIVLVNGKPISEPWLQKNVPAILEAWEPGNLGGQAVAEVLFGEVNPSGKLPLTVARSVGQLRMIYNHKPSAYFHKYADEKNTPLYPFGFGLSYTEYSYGTPTLSETTLNKNSTVTVAVQITNTGDVDGEEIAQLYIRDNVSSVTRAVKELKGYKRVALKAGETKTVSFSIDAESLAFYDINMDYCVEPGTFSIMTGSSSNTKDLTTTTLTVTNRIKL
ncbi:glycoside hydrolase family 3 N-terminal domain-containing protein [uncultured Polaribacter sp.]|uniref:glycoside hydrolase family 3 N-terminal domain-containing protein n=1 Tax=uncultured Polaribacter sp. TaxID=174711 RepID=UPI00262689A1|nr:glycoside hydrolase family 3 N-terminal domain-containing protein [uncultured Polaribacter sp.]